MLNDLNVVEVVGNVGFPILITIYLLHRFEKKLQNLETAILDLVSSAQKGRRDRNGR